MITRIKSDNLFLFEEIYKKRTSKPLTTKSVEDPNLFLFVIHEEVVYGWISLVKIPKVGHRDGVYYIDELYVYPNYENHGYASALLRHVKEHFTDYPVRLMVNENNANAVYLYQKHGFEVMNKAYYMERTKL